MSLGTVTEPNGSSMSANLTCESYGMDFIKEDGEWKIWHLRAYVYFYTPLGEAWYDSNMAASQTDMAPPSSGEEAYVEGNYFEGYSVEDYGASEIKLPVLTQ